jgi:hypothetical protein
MLCLRQAAMRRNGPARPRADSHAVRRREMRKVYFTEFVARDEFGVAVDRLCFGHPIERAAHKRSRARIPRRYRFLPGRVFAIVCQRWCPDGRQHRALAVVETLSDRTRGFAIPGISSSVLVHAMVDQTGPAGHGGGVDRLLTLIHSIKLSGIDPASLPALYWKDASFLVMLQQRPPMPGRKVA